VGRTSSRRKGGRRDQVRDCRLHLVQDVDDLQAAHECRLVARTLARLVARRDVGKPGERLEERGIVVGVQASTELAGGELPQEVHRDLGGGFLLRRGREEGEQEVPLGRRAAGG